jgi:hypothetical protein
MDYNIIMQRAGLAGISKKSTDKLQEKVRKAIADDWKPLGSPFVLGYYAVCQAMVKD